MDQKKLEAIIEAIIAESRRPEPTHANLARLIAMALHELIAMNVFIASGETMTSTTTNGKTEIIYGD